MIPIRIYYKHFAIAILNGGGIAGAAIAASLNLTIQRSTNYYNRWSISSKSTLASTQAIKSHFKQQHKRIRFCCKKLEKHY